MHEEFQKSFKDNDLSISVVEEGISCPKNYLSRFINGKQTLPSKWEKKIREYLKNVVFASKAGIQAKDAEKFFQKAWVPMIEKYCLEEAGIDPEKLIDEHRGLKKRIAELNREAAKIKVNNLNIPPAASNYAINTTAAKSTLSDWAEQNRRKKLGLDKDK